MIRNLQWILFILMLCLLGGIYLYVTSAIEAKNQKVSKPRPPAKEQVLDVSVLSVTAQEHTAKLTVSGTTAARFQLDLSSKVSGDIKQMNANFEIGNRLNHGTELIKLSNIELTSKLSQAKNQQAKAILTLKEEERLADQAETEWQAAGLKGDPDSELVLRKPQLAVATRTLQEAQSAVAEALDDIENLSVKMPFNGLIVEKKVSPNTQISAGALVATIYSTDRIEINLPLSSSDWQKLPSPEIMIDTKWPVLVQAVDQSSAWQGYVLRAANHIDPVTRMRHLVIAVDTPLDLSPKLLPGLFVEVTVTGKPLSNLWRLPNSSLSQNSEIWYIDKESRLQAFSTLPAFADSDAIYIKVPETLNQSVQKVLIKPYNSYVKGTLVNPLEVAPK